MGKTQRNFVLGRMNKSLDERLVPNGEYIDALNVRLGSTEASEVGVIENAVGNTQLTALYFPDAATLLNVNLSSEARTIGAYEDGANETLYWFVHDPAFTLGDTGKCDMIVSFNTTAASINYHVISIDDGGGNNTTLNFDLEHLITGVSMVGRLLFFTDNLNPPRFINVDNNYPNPLVNGNPVNPNVPIVPVLIAWSFTAGSFNTGSTTQIGFHQATLQSCPVSIGAIGIGETPSTTQIPLPGTGCYNFQNTLVITKGYAIAGVNNGSQYALAMFINDSAGGVTMGFTNSSGSGSPGTVTLNGTITGSDGSSGTWSCSTTISNNYFDETGATIIGPESIDNSAVLEGLTLTENVTYTMYI